MRTHQTICAFFFQLFNFPIKPRIAQYMWVIQAIWKWLSFREIFLTLLSGSHQNIARKPNQIDVSSTWKFFFNFNIWTYNRNFFHSFIHANLERRVHIGGVIGCRWRLTNERTIHSIRKSVGCCVHFIMSHRYLRGVDDVNAGCTIYLSVNFWPAEAKIEN